MEAAEAESVRLFWKLKRLAFCRFRFLVFGAGSGAASSFGEHASMGNCTYNYVGSKEPQQQVLKEHTKFFFETKTCFKTKISIQKIVPVEKLLQGHSFFFEK